MTMVPTRKTTVNSSRFFSECWKASEPSRLAKFSNHTKWLGSLPVACAALWTSVMEVLTLIAISP